jgi:hypothetical protein
MRKGDVFVLEKPYAGFKKGDRFKLVVAVDGGNNCTNYRCVVDDPRIKDLDDIFHHRTLPGEYCVPVPKVGSSTTVHANQGDRDATVLAVLGDEVLLEYEMPAGKTFLRIENFVTGVHRSVSQLGLPKKWRKELEA